MPSRTPNQSKTIRAEVCRYGLRGRYAKVALASFANPLHFYYCLRPTQSSRPASPAASDANEPGSGTARMPPAATVLS
jgi:hypothetical protein